MIALCKQHSITEPFIALESQRATMQDFVEAINALKTEAENNKNSVTTDVQTISQKRSEFADSTMKCIIHGKTTVAISPCHTNHKKAPAIATP